jgi:hypothetical protein
MLNVTPLIKTFILALAGLFAQTLFAQVGIGTTTPSSSSQLEIASNSKGLLIPRIALTSLSSASPVSAPATSLLVYNTATAGTFPANVKPGYYFWNGAAWQRLEDQTNNPAEFHWSFLEGNPTQNGLGATLVGNASWQTNFVRLTSAGNAQNGQIYWVKDINWDAPLHISIQTYAGGGTGADGTWLFWGAGSSAVGASGFYNNASGGIAIWYDEYIDRVQVYKNGSLQQTFSDISNLDNAKWQVQDVYFGVNPNGTRYVDIHINNGVYLGTVQLGSYSAGGDYFGLGAVTGGANHNHDVRRILIESGVHKPR